MFTKLCSEAHETFGNSVYPLDFKQCKHKYQEIIIIIIVNFSKTKKLHDPIERVQFEVFEKFIIKISWKHIFTIVYVKPPFLDLN